MKHLSVEKKTSRKKKLNKNKAKKKRSNKIRTRSGRKLKSKKIPKKYTWQLGGNEGKLWLGINNDGIVSDIVEQTTLEIPDKFKSNSKAVYTINIELPINKATEWKNVYSYDKGRYMFTFDYVMDKSIRLSPSNSGTKKPNVPKESSTVDLEGDTKTHERVKEDPTSINPKLTAAIVENHNSFISAVSVLEERSKLSRLAKEYGMDTYGFMLLVKKILDIKFPGWRGKYT